FEPVGLAKDLHPKEGRMSFYRNAKLGLAGRYALVSAIAGGMTLKAARRPAAHGRQRVRALRASRPPRHRRPLESGPPAPRRRRLCARDRRRPLAARVR